ncbi:hypothetical protein XNA1_3450001 [Xenorhabdus nematophila str. Anatoliense]|nr:hypothetical protein XNA1_3450001 [Xenorhabdus nematophila str. Anatoliense]
MTVKHKNDKEIAVITYSGEVYNFKELRNELIYKGHNFYIK